jgi:hypothetical protein
MTAARRITAERAARRGATRAVGLRRLLALSAALAAPSGCGETTAPPAPPAPTETAPTPIDELAPDELAEGPASAFGFPFPARLQVDSRTRDRVSAVGPAAFEDVANYVRRRVDAAQTSTGPGKTVLDRVTIRSPRPLHEAEAPREAQEGFEEVLRIDVAKTPRGRVRLVVSRDLRPKPVEGLNEDQRWERLGIRKDGKPVDPKRFE